MNFNAVTKMMVLIKLDLSTKKTDTSGGLAGKASGGRQGNRGHTCSPGGLECFNLYHTPSWSTQTAPNRDQRKRRP